MKVGLHQFHAQTIDWFQKAVSTPGVSRNALALELCEREQWTGTTGELCVASARKALPVLAERLGVALPATHPSFGSGGREAPPEAAYPDRALRCPLSALGEVTVEPVSGDEERRQWESMMRTHHPQGWRQAPGGQLRYWVCSSRYGRLGGLNFCAASWHQKVRDAFIGWSGEARVSNLSRVLNNQRLLILPGVRVHGLASRVLELACAQVVEDWEAKYNVRPVLAYTYVSPEHPGTSYRAAGWQRGEGGTSGCSPGGGTVVRAVWLKPLVRGWRTVLCAEPVRQIQAAPALHMDEKTDWADVEYGRSTHPDGRVCARILRMGRAWLERPGASLPQIFPRRAELRAAYRLLSNGRVKMEHILEPHWAAMVDRCRLEPVVLALQDTTALNYASRPATAGLVNIGGGGSGVQGLKAHVGLAVNEAGRPLGVYALDADYADRLELESERWGEGLARACELERACARTRVVTVCDREGDLWGLLDQARSQSAGLLVRVRRGSRREVLLAGGKRECLWAHMERLPSLAEKTVQVVACGGGGSVRGARCGWRCGRRGCGWRRRGGHPQVRTRRRLRCWRSVRLKRTRRPVREAEPLHWLLLTTEGQADADGAGTAVRHYELRWTIEEYFRTLKTGAGIEKRQLDHADDLRKCLTFDAITACEVFSLDRMARDRPQTPADEVVSEDDLLVLNTRLDDYGIRRPQPPPGEAPDIRSFVVDVARLAGFHPRRSQPLPGIMKLWEGYVLLRESVFTYRAIRRQSMVQNE